MRHHARIIPGVVLAGLLALAASPALAQAEDGSFTGTFYVVDVDPGNVLGLEGNTGWGAALSGQITPSIGLEGSLHRVGDLEFVQVSQSTSLREFRFGSLFFFGTSHERFLPYVALGLGYMEFGKPVALETKALKQAAKEAGRKKQDFKYHEDAARYDNGFGLHWGLGAHVFVSKRVSLRFDLRWMTSLDNDVSFNNFAPMFGLSIWSGEGS